MTVLVRPSAIPATQASRGFSRPHPACTSAQGQSEASLLELARSYDPDELTSSDCHEQSDLSFTRQCLSLPAQVPKQGSGGSILLIVAPRLASILRGLLILGLCVWIGTRQEAPSCPIPFP